jgi:16S rRNA (guanine(966)-N(2))-methyltransferase RsmD
VYNNKGKKGKILQNALYITRLLNICYISINILDIEKKRDKIVLSKKGKKMRIISGKARGTNLYTLNGLTTRPTQDRVKESLFNIIQSEIENANFLDLFSGSGAIALEAISRGAQKAILCDNSKEAIDIINRNIEKTHFNEQTEVYKLDYERLLNDKISSKQDIIFIDPPYKTSLASKAVELIVKNNILNKDGLIIIETDEPERIAQEIEQIKIQIVDQRKYGRAHLIFLR